MVRRVRVPAEAKLYLTANELFGWPDGYKWTPAPIKKRKGAKPVRTIRPKKAEPVMIGEEV